MFEQLYPAGQLEDHPKRACYMESIAKLNKIIKSANSQNKKLVSAASGEDHVLGGGASGQINTNQSHS